MKKFILLTFILAILALFSTTAFAAVEKPISFLQDDSKWGSKSYSITGSQSQTIASSGCGPTAMAMVLHYYGEEDITPVVTKATRASPRRLTQICNRILSCCLIC